MPKLSLGSKRNSDYNFSQGPALKTFAFKKPHLMIRKKVGGESLSGRSGEHTVRSLRESANCEIDSFLDSENDYNY